MVANSINICVHFNLSITYQCYQNSFQAIIEIKSNCIFTFFSHIIKPFVLLLWNTLIDNRHLSACIYSCNVFVWYKYIHISALHIEYNSKMTSTIGSGVSSRLSFTFIVSVLV